VNVIKATNRQTEVKVEAFESLAPFHKDLEEYYKAKAASRKYPIFYERRSKQYENIPGVKGSQVVTLSAQIKAFVSACLAQPQSTHRYFGEVLESNRGRMFVAGDSLERYYVSATILNVMEILFRENAIKRKYKTFKYHLVFLIYNYFMQLERSKKRPDFDKIIQILDDKSTILPIVKAGAASIDAALKSLRLSSDDGSRSKALTDLLAKELSLPQKTA